MGLFEQAYPQEGIAQKLEAAGVQLDGTIMQPWGIDQDAVIDSSGNIVALVQDNVFGGNTITDSMNGVIATTTPNAMGGENMMNESFQQVGFSTDNVLGGENLYGSDMSLETISFDTPIGEHLYDSNMNLLGLNPEHGSYIDMNTTMTTSTPFEGVTEYQSFDAIANLAFPDMTSTIDSFSTIEDLGTAAADGLGILDWL